MALVQDTQCPKCKRLAGERHKATTKMPTVATLMRWDENGYAKATDGCKTEPDGVCVHGHVSWLIRMGMI